MLDHLQKLREDRAIDVMKASREQQRTEALETWFYRFIALKFLPLVDTEDVILNLSRHIPMAEKLDMVELPVQPKLIPFKDELATAPTSRGIYGYIHVLFYLACAAFSYYGMWIRSAEAPTYKSTGTLKTEAQPYYTSFLLDRIYARVSYLASHSAFWSPVLLPTSVGPDQLFYKISGYIYGAFTPQIIIMTIEGYRKRNSMNLLAV